MVQLVGLEVIFYVTNYSDPKSAPRDRLLVRYGLRLTHPTSI